MQIYPIDPSFVAGEFLELAVQPLRRFSIAIYQQQDQEALTSVSGVVVAGAEHVTTTLVRGKYVFQSAGSEAPVRFDEDWGWPTLTVKPNVPELESGAYVAVAYEVGQDGAPLTDLGRRCSAHKPLYGSPPDSDSMALVIARPRSPSARLAYIIPTATYHAYNSTGGGCFYGDPIHRTQPASKVSLRRPGGGLGAQLGEPHDPYDTRSPRQQFTHWDAKFIRWLRARHLACDFYTDLDLHRGTFLDAVDYSCMLSVGHHEYWSQEMRDHVACFIAGGGNLAVFSGNTCYRPVDFGVHARHDDMKEMNRLGDSWPDFSETDLIGLSYGYGGGKWGRWAAFGAGWNANASRSASPCVRRIIGCSPIPGSRTARPSALKTAWPATRWTACRTFPTDSGCSHPRLAWRAGKWAALARSASFGRPAAAPVRAGCSTAAPRTGRGF